MKIGPTARPLRQLPVEPGARESTSLGGMPRVGRNGTPCGLPARRRSPHVDSENGAVRMSENRLSDTSDRDASDPRAAMTADDDQFDVVLLGITQNDLVGTGLGSHERFPLHGKALELVAQELLRGAHYLVERFLGRPVGNRAEGTKRRQDATRHLDVVENEELMSELTVLTRGLLHRAQCRVGQIRGDEERPGAPVGSRDEHGAGCRAHDSLGDAAQQHASQTRMTLVPDDDQASVVLLRLGNDRRIGHIGEVHVDVDLIGIQFTVLASQLDEPLGQLAAERHLPLGVALRQVGKNRMDGSRQVNDVHHQQPDAGGLRPSGPLAQSLDGGITEITRHQNRSRLLRHPDSILSTRGRRNAPSREHCAIVPLGARWWTRTMGLKDGEKGVVLQRDRETYAVAPHVPCGVVTPDLLRKLADAAEKHGCLAMKITSAQRIALIGLRADQVDAVWQDLGMEPGQMSGHYVRSVKACPGSQYCKRAQGDSLEVGLEIDRRHHAQRLPGKMKIGVSGCGHQCAETSIKDVGLVGFKKGWTVLVGGAAGARTRVAQPLLAELSDAEAIRVVDHIVDYFERHAKAAQRLYKVIDRLGRDHLRQSILDREPEIAERERDRAAAP
jgi:dissimilatory sulfite reductase (desulfoviridin) alpha/beta subunit